MQLKCKYAQVHKGAAVAPYELGQVSDMFSVYGTDRPTKQYYSLQIGLISGFWELEFQQDFSQT